MKQREKRSMRPILMNTQMVRAILSGQKTETRRVVRPYPPCELRKVPDGRYAGKWCLYSEHPMLNPSNQSPWGAEITPPYQPGDILYVRETWTILYYVDPDGYTHYDQPMYYYAADGEPDITLIDPDGFEKDDQRIRWRPSIHMPKEAARIFLKVTDVRVERLQEITDKGARREGCGESDVIYCNGALRCEFVVLWDSTVPQKDRERCYWNANPWVWVIEFERCEKPEEEE